MAKRHSEDKAVKSVAHICKVDAKAKTLLVSKGAIIDIKTPCHVDGVCHNCNSPESICNYVHFLRNSPKGRHVVVLVGEDLGY